jgi:membrane-bound inhibitor of C-type lysozyme
MVGAENTPPANIPAVAGLVAAEVAEIAGAFETEVTGRELCHRRSLAISVRQRNDVERDWQRGSALVYTAVSRGADMNRYRNIVLGAACAAFVAGLTPVLAQSTTFRHYHCADGSEFIVGLYPYDTRAYLQIDGGPVTLRRRLAVSGRRYAGGGVTLKVNKAGRLTIKHARQPETACEVL